MAQIGRHAAGNRWVSSSNLDLGKFMCGYYFTIFGAIPAEILKELDLLGKSLMDILEYSRRLARRYILKLLKPLAYSVIANIVFLAYKPFILYF